MDPPDSREEGEREREILGVVKYTDAREPARRAPRRATVISDILFRMGKQKEIGGGGRGREMRTGRVAAPVSFRGGHPSLLFSPYFSKARASMLPSCTARFKMGDIYVYIYIWPLWSGWTGLKLSLESNRSEKKMYKCITV